MNPPVISPVLLSAVKAHLMAKAYTESIRPIVEGYQIDILKKHQFPYKEGKLMALGIAQTGDPAQDCVLNPKHAYLMHDTDAEVFFAEIEEAKKAYSFGKDLEEGCCPLLVAENLQLQALRVMIDEAAYITGFRYDDIQLMEHYDEAEALIEKIVLNHPSIDKSIFTAEALLSLN